MADWPYSTARWQRLRKDKLARNPLCQDCRDHEGRVVIARVVDHVRAISDGGEAFPDVDGLRSLCESCHSRKTARGAEHGAVRSDKPRKGCNPDGSPIDPRHPWSAAPPAGTSAAKSRSDVGPPPNPQTQLVSNRNRLRGRNG